MTKRRNSLAFITNIMGNIGAGKTSASDIFQNYGYYYSPEPVDDNPYLKKYYPNKKRWCFTMETHLELQYSNAMKLFKDSLHRFVVMDWGLPPVYVLTMKEYGVMTQEEFDTFFDFRKALNTPIPDLSIFLDVSPEECMNRIIKRGREFEIKNLDLKFLREKHLQYERFLCDFPGKVIKIKNDNLEEMR